MCGIAGFICKDIIEAKKRKEKASICLNRRGPDSWDHYSDANSSLHLVHCRLAIQDLSISASQPMKCSQSIFFSL